MFEIDIRIRVGGKQRRIARPRPHPGTTDICSVCGSAGTARGWAGHMAARQHGGWVPVEHGHTREEIALAGLARRPHGP